MTKGIYDMKLFRSIKIHFLSRINSKKINNILPVMISTGYITAVLVPGSNGGTGGW
jgi:hypothetical protein